MNKTDARNLIRALRSGKYQQGEGQLRTCDTAPTHTRYCCLGVLCKIKGLEELTNGFKSQGIIFNSLPPPKIAEMKSRDGNLGSSKLWESTNQETLANLNDEGFTFEEIADIIYGFIRSNLIHTL